MQVIMKIFLETMKEKLVMINIIVMIKMGVIIIKLMEEEIMAETEIKYR